nr:hypothetical protein Iba_chr11fCG6340 [Ipomoea batatas]
MWFQTPSETDEPETPAALPPPPPLICCLPLTNHHQELSPEIVAQKLPCLVQICSPKELLLQPSSPREAADRRQAVVTAAIRQGSSSFRRRSSNLLLALNLHLSPRPAAMVAGYCEQMRQQLLPVAKQQSPLGLEPPPLSLTSSNGGRQRRRWDELWRGSSPLPLSSAKQRDQQQIAARKWWRSARGG